VRRTIELDAVLDAPRPGPSDPERDGQWLAGQREINALVLGTVYDPRRVLGLSGASLDAWQVQRRTWLVSGLKDVTI